MLGNHKHLLDSIKHLVGSSKPLIGTPSPWFETPTVFRQLITPIQQFQAHVASPKPLAVFSTEIHGAYLELQGLDTAYQ